MAVNHISCPGDCKIARRFIESWALTAGYRRSRARPHRPRHRRGDAPISCATPIKTRLIVPLLCPPQLTKGFSICVCDADSPIDACMLKGRDLDDVKPGGLGLHLSRSVFTIVEHIPLPDGNELHSISRWRNHLLNQRRNHEVFLSHLARFDHGRTIFIPCTPGGGWLSSLAPLQPSRGHGQAQ